MTTSSLQDPKSRQQGVHHPGSTPRASLWETIMVDMPFPSGRQFVIRDGKYVATVTEVGGGLRELSYAGVDLVDGFAADRLVDGSRGQVLAPWPNRLRDGSWRWGGRELQLPIDEPLKGNSASHGGVRWAPWTLETEEQRRVAMNYRLYPQPGYPFPLAFGITYAPVSYTHLRAHETRHDLVCR